LVIKKTKNVLGFVTTSFILLVMVAPTTTATASLQQQHNDYETSSAGVNATIDEPNIPIGPAEEEEPREPVPDNENETHDDDDDGDNVIPDCTENGYKLPCRVGDVVCFDFEEGEGCEDVPGAPCPPSAAT
jgi:hypothetical protein